MPEKPDETPQPGDNWERWRGGVDVKLTNIGHLMKSVEDEMKVMWQKMDDGFKGVHTELSILKTCMNKSSTKLAYMEGKASAFGGLGALAVLALVRIFGVA